jgi:hypothetical protein
VLVVSDARFHQATDRAIVAPSIATLAADESPWRPGADERFAVDVLTTLPVERLAEAVGSGRRGDTAPSAASRHDVLVKHGRVIVHGYRRPASGSVSARSPACAAASMLVVCGACLLYHDA